MSDKTYGVALGVFSGEILVGEVKDNHFVHKNPATEDAISAVISWMIRHHPTESLTLTDSNGVKVRLTVETGI